MSDQTLRAKVETTHGREPTEGVDHAALVEAALSGRRVPHAAFRCPCGGLVDTRDGTMVKNDEWARHVGVPCSQCDRTYTVEVRPG